MWNHKTSVDSDGSVLCSHCGTLWTVSDLARRSSLGKYLLVFSALALLVTLVLGIGFSSAWAILPGFISFNLYVYGLALRDPETLRAMHERGPK